MHSQDRQELADDGLIYLSCPRVLALCKEIGRLPKSRVGRRARREHQIDLLSIGAHIAPLHDECLAEELRSKGLQPAPHLRHVSLRDRLPPEGAKVFSPRLKSGERAL